MVVLVADVSTCPSLLSPLEFTHNSSVSGILDAAGMLSLKETKLAASCWMDVIDIVEPMLPYFLNLFLLIILA